MSRLWTTGLARRAPTRLFDGAMFSEFRPESIAAQVARYLRDQIADGAWDSWMPAERELAERLRVSRGTVRAALAMLQAERVVQTAHGVGTRARRREAVRRQTGGATEAPVCLLMPEPLNALRPYLIIWIDLLRSLLADSGIALHLHVAPSCFGPRGGAPLERLVAQHPGSCWVLALSNGSVQRWFERRGLPCVVLGQPAPESTLPAVAVDMRALGRHAAGELLRQGHRRLGIVVPSVSSPGVAAAVEGFVGAVGNHGDAASFESIEVRADGVDAAIRRVLRRARAAAPLTGALVLNPMVFLSLLTGLPTGGVLVPRDFSLITTHGDPFLGYVRPTAARYAVAHGTFVRKLLRMVLQVRAGGVRPGGLVLVAPDYVPGESQGPAPRSRGR